MYTCDGKKMSVRAERIYAWLNGRNIMLTTFSTDDHVAMYYKELEKALKDIQNGKNLPTENKIYIAQMEKDLLAIMNRRPQNRAELKGAKTFFSPVQTQTQTETEAQEEKTYSRNFATLEID